ncbi:hypothetical protein K470DRAFT_212595 [Piedraia hortae CBS 480.64]|uniref:Cell wall mannoprotein PIR1-like C-terminal domain-containing protein n=1 Tax=Piedraia hortae CBS 480.64 TaxID=1314780 RepID=A0A6A7C4I1_9PEZI|nr:hypothetical protein K470DRAFT_212595 [Piedraia hortae CBS 480.64]
MRSSFAVVAGLVGLAVASPMPQGVTSAIAPSASAAGCSASYSGKFEIQVVNITSKRMVKVRSKPRADALTMTLKDGVLKDAKGRTGYIAANHQFQFDEPPQTGAIYTAGFSVCPNNSLAIGNDATWAQCLSGTFYNLYDDSEASQCSPVHIQVLGGSGSNNVASQTADGQVTGSPVASVSQISDGQVQATSGAVSQISDGQVQATSAAAGGVSQISDGQVQAGTATGAAVSQISDGQVQAGTATGSAASASASAEPYTGAASISSVKKESFALVAAIVALAYL